MKFSFSAEQDEFRGNLRRLLAERVPTKEVRRLMESATGWEREGWRQLDTALGLSAIAIPEEHGGYGFGFAELCIVLEEFGRALVPAPYLATALAARAILHGGSDADRASLLPGIATGDTIATLASAEDSGSWEAAATTLTATPSGDEFRLDGHKSFVMDGASADLILLLARAPGSTGEAGLSLFAVDAAAAGLTRTPLPVMDPTRHLARLTFAAVPARLIGTEGAAAAPYRRTMMDAAAALANEMAGGAERLRGEALA